MTSTGTAPNKTDCVGIFLSGGSVGSVRIAVCDAQTITLEVSAVRGTGHLTNRETCLLSWANYFSLPNLSIFTFARHPGFYVILAIGRSPQFLGWHFHHSEIKTSTVLCKKNNREKRNIAHPELLSSRNGACINSSFHL